MKTKVSDLRTEALQALLTDLGAEFNQKRTEELTISGVAERTELAQQIAEIRTELANREAAEAEAAKPPVPTAEELAEQAAAADALVDAEAEEAKDEEEAAAAAENEVPAPTEELASKGDEDEDKDEKKDEKADDSKGDAVTAGAVGPTGLESSGLDSTSVAPATITAGADIPGITAGSPIEDFSGVARAFIERRKALRGAGREGDGDNVVVASIAADYPAERTLTSRDFEENMAKIEAVASPDVITASGGLCAPLTPYYGIQQISQAFRPVRDALPNFSADRGGVVFLPPPRLSDVTGAIGVTTAAQDAGTYGDGVGETPFKPCLHVTCPEEEEVVIQAIHRCLTFGNFSARTYPEQVTAWLSLALAAHARRAETLLLDGIDAASTQTTGAATYSAFRTLLPQIDQAVAAYRSRNRTGNLSLRVLIPDWAKELLRSDVARGIREDLSPLTITDSQIVSWFTSRNVQVTFYIDSATSTGQIFGAQADGPLTPFPTEVVWYLYIEGSFVFLDGGTLDLGLVRDSTLNKTNDYQIFAETFENVVFYGIESIKVTSTICPSGVHAPAATGQAPCFV